MLAAAADAGVDTRVDLEDILVLPDGRAATCNAELIAAAPEQLQSDRHVALLKYLLVLCFYP